MDNNNQTPGIPRFLQDQMFPSGIIKPRMLAADSTMVTGDTYFVNSDGIFQRLAAGSSTQVLTTVSGVPAWISPPNNNIVTIVDRNVTEIQVGNTTNNTSIYTYTIPGGMLGTNKQVRVIITGAVLNNSGGTLSVVYKAGLGSYTSSTNTVGYSTGAAATFFRWEIHLTAQATNKINVWYSLLGQGFATGQSATATLLPAADQTFNAYVQWSGADANAIVDKEIAITELL